MSGRLWERVKARALRLAAAAAEREARRIARDVAADFPELTVEQTDADVTISGRGLARRRADDVRLRFIGRDKR